MKAAVLCNGPSRNDYTTRTGYDFVIGCNIPWCDVDATVVLDEAVVQKWSSQPDLISVPAYFSRKAWMFTDEIKKRKFFEKFLIELVDVLPEYDSSGHHAAMACARRGASEIDIYGCDSWFDQTIASYTHKYFKNLNPDDSKKYVYGWRNRWNHIINQNPNIKFTFIRNST